MDKKNYNNEIDIEDIEGRNRYLLPIYYMYFHPTFRRLINKYDSKYVRLQSIIYGICFGTTLQTILMSSILLTDIVKSESIYSIITASSIAATLPITTNIISGISEYMNISETSMSRNQDLSNIENYVSDDNPYQAPKSNLD